MQSHKQFIFLRKDLKDFTTGMLVAQACHGAISAVHKYRDNPKTKEYLENLLNMTTIVYEITEDQIKDICDSLERMKIEYHLWMEHGTIPTCIATRPVDMNENEDFNDFRLQFQLF